MRTPEERIAEALDRARRSGGVDGAHHKMWCIDQMVRILTDCPTVTRTFKDPQGVEHPYPDLGESEDYRVWVAETRDGPEGPNSYDWDTGIP